MEAQAIGTSSTRNASRRTAAELAAPLPPSEGGCPLTCKLAAAGCRRGRFPAPAAALPTCDALGEVGCETTWVALPMFASLVGVVAATLHSPAAAPTNLPTSCSRTRASSTRASTAAATIIAAAAPAPAASAASCGLPDGTEEGIDADSGPSTPSPAASAAPAIPTTAAAPARTAPAAHGQTLCRVVLLQEPGGCGDAQQCPRVASATASPTVPGGLRGTERRGRLDVATQRPRAACASRRPSERRRRSSACGKVVGPGQTRTARGPSRPRAQSSRVADAKVQQAPPTGIAPTARAPKRTETGNETLDPIQKE